jgi:hypothetical protein
MKKIILTLFITVLAFHIHAQVCNQYSPTVAGAKSYILPDSATGIAHACAGMPYEQVMNIKVFKDTLIGGFILATVDSAVINLDVAAIGLPAGFTIVSVPAMLPPNATNNYNHLTLRGDSVGCVKITGTAPTALGTTPLTIPFKIRVKAVILGQTIDSTLSLNNTNYKFIVDAVGSGTCFAASVTEAYGNVLDINAIPNPTSNNLNIQINAFENENVTVTLTNIFGQQVAAQTGILHNGLNNFRFNVSSLPSGIYTYTLSNGKNKISNKWIKE